MATPCWRRELLWRAVHPTDGRARPWAARERPLDGDLHAHPGRYQHAIEAWTDAFGTWRRDARQPLAGLDVKLEIAEGRNLLAAPAARGVPGALDPRAVPHADVGRSGAIAA